MATIEKRQRKKGTVWKATIRMKGHPRVSQTFDRKSQALAWAEDTEYTLRNGGHIGDAPSGDMSFKKAIDRYLKDVSSKKAKSTETRDGYSANALRPYFEGKTLQGILASDVAQYRDERLLGNSGSTVRIELALLSHLFRIARSEWSLDVINPVDDVKRPTAARGRLRFLTEKEIKVLLKESMKANNKSLYSYIILQLHTGLRPSEGAGLRWKQVNLKKRRIDLTKTKTDPRVVPLTEKAVQTLRALCPKRKVDSDTYVFLPKHPSKICQDRPNLFFKAGFKAAVERAKIKDFTMHDLRHTAASYLIMAGVDIRTVADILGHKTLQMTMRYTHLLDNHTLAAVDKINSLGD